MPAACLRPSDFLKHKKTALKGRFQLPGSTVCRQCLLLFCVPRCAGEQPQVRLSVITGLSTSSSIFLYHRNIYSRQLPLSISYVSPSLRSPDCEYPAPFGICEQRIRSCMSFPEYPSMPSLSVLFLRASSFPFTMIGMTPSPLPGIVIFFSDKCSGARTILTFIEGRFK